MTLIHSTSELLAFIERAQNDTFITIDTEFIRETTYWPQLCLIQVGTKDEAVAIDPLSQELNLEPFLDFLYNPKILKVFHAARQDLEIFYNLREAVPSPLFDSQVAAMVCGYGESASYESLVETLAKAKLDKSQRFTDWSRRPLSSRQIEYALGDVTYLRTVYEKLQKRLDETHRGSWVQDEMKVLSSPDTYKVDPEKQWERIRYRTAKPRMLAILKLLAAWREIEAQKRNVPRGRILKDETLLEIAAIAPKDKDSLGRMRGLNPAIANSRLGEDIISVVKSALALPLDQCPQMKATLPSPPGMNSALEMLKMLLRIKADEHNVAAKLLATSSDLETFVRSLGKEAPFLEGWRYTVFGEDAQKILEGQTGIVFKKNKIKLIPAP
ncbi:Ribonuclease D [Candidatus Bealeia paramacronuclearis]|uniref:Ribonuclease D n=1 Tax=Candidatus Bealeia paramacronuclearis TaxID=1921001 RepID=A0ABZ2C9I8_9PROT|nr:Ribonuclease D [Candidatus Bealeia paramacronuclearis]